jgi:hypothetical protein
LIIWGNGGGEVTDNPKPQLKQSSQNITQNGFKVNLFRKDDFELK